MAEALSGFLNNILKVEGIEEAFSCFLVHRTESEAESIAKWQEELSDYFETLNPDHLDGALRQYLHVASQSSQSRMQVLLELLEHCVKKGTLQARKACEFIITTDQLHYSNSHFWIYCFTLIKNVIELVEYKGVREVMKGCCEKAKGLPLRLTAGIQPQSEALLNVAEKIMNRNACLLPGYLLVNELQKVYSECPHWSLAALFSDYIESFRPCAQMLSIVGHSQMRPVVEHSGCPEHLVNPWKLDPLNLRFALKGTLPYESELLEKQTGLLRYVLEQPYSRDMVCGMLGLNKQHKQHCQAIEEQLVELVISALERTETDGDETDGLWLHLSSQLIYFVLFQFASFPNIVMSLHTRLQVSCMWMNQ